MMSIISDPGSNVHTRIPSEFKRRYDDHYLRTIFTNSLVEAYSALCHKRSVLPFIAAGSQTSVT
jgi:hypothetical protein